MDISRRWYAPLLFLKEKEGEGGISCCSLTTLSSSRGGVFVATLFDRSREDELFAALFVTGGEDELVAALFNTGPGTLAVALLEKESPLLESD